MAFWWENKMGEMVGIAGCEILDSRGNTRVEFDMLLASRVIDRAAVPSRAFTGCCDAIDLHDGEKPLYLVRRDCKIRFDCFLWTCRPACAAGAQVHGAQKHD